MAESSKRLIADVAPEFFWEVKQFSAATQLKQKTLTALAVHKLMGSTYPLSELICDPEEYNKVKNLELGGGLNYVKNNETLQTNNSERLEEISSDHK